MAGSSLLIGAFDGAREHFERALRYSEQMPDRALTSLIGADLRVFMRAFGCHALWHLGLADQARHWNDEAVAISRAATDSFSLAIALCYGAMLSQFARDARSAEILAVEAIALCREQHFAYYLAWAQIIHGWAQSAQGWSTDGIAEMERGLAEIDATGGRLRHGYYLSRLAEAHGWAGDPDKAVEILDQAIALSDRMGDHWRDADLHRLKGVLALGLDRAGEAEATFQQALAIAREQGAKSLELQAALDLAKLWSDQGRGVEARALLAPIHAAFTEGFETRDLKEAKAMLDELA
jgi:predicted ATPase